MKKAVAYSGFAIILTHGKNTTWNVSLEKRPDLFSWHGEENQNQKGVHGRDYKAHKDDRPRWCLLWQYRSGQRGPRDWRASCGKCWPPLGQMESFPLRDRTQREKLFQIFEAERWTNWNAISSWWERSQEIRNWKLCACFGVQDKRRLRSIFCLRRKCESDPIIRLTNRETRSGNGAGFLFSFFSRYGNYNLTTPILIVYCCWHSDCFLW